VKRFLYLLTGFLLIALLLATRAVAEDIRETAVSALHAEHAVWNKVPIAFVVPVGIERMLVFPEKIEVRNLDAHLTTDKVSLLNNEGTLYVQAKQSFAPVRLAIVLKERGTTVLVDISACPNADDTPLEVVLPEERDETRPDKSAPSTMMQPMTLMRYAIQHLYAPERLVVENDNISRSPMYTSKSVDLFYDKNITAMPLISWHGGDYTVTAILLQNNEHRCVYLDPRHIRGQWIASSFYPANTLSAAGSLHDRTTLFLISNRSFNNALHGMKEYGYE
jgi:integrating conjugative element protein (TIGR03749 family)